MEKENTGNPSFGESAIREYLETWLHGQMHPLAVWLVSNHPGLANDKVLTVIVPWLVPLAEAAIRSHFGKSIEKSKVRKMLFEIGTDLTRELLSEIEEVLKNPPQGGGKKEQSKTEVTVYPTIWTNIAKPEIGFVDGCSAKHQNEMRPVVKKRKNAPDEHGEESVLRDGFSQIEFADFIDGGGRAPATPAEGWKNGCCCKRRIAEAKATLQAQRDAKTKAEAPKPKTEPLVTRDEIRAGARAVGGAFAGVGRGIQTAVLATGRGIQAAAAKGEAIVRQLPDRARALDGRVADHAQRVGDTQARKREIGVFARSNGIRDVGAFKEAVLATDTAQGTVDLSTLQIAALHRRFGRKDR